MTLITPTRGQWTPPSRTKTSHIREDAARQVLGHEAAGRRNSLMAGVVISAAVPAFFCALVFGPWIEWTPDAFHYLALARQFIETGRFPAERITTPPGFPLLLVPLMSSSDLPLAGIRVLLAGGFALTGVLSFLLYRRLIGDGWAIFAAVVTGLSASLLAQSTALLSECVYIPLSLLAMLILTRWSVEGPEGFADLVGGGMAVAAAWAVRSTGILLVPVAAWTVFRGGKGTFGARVGRAVLVTLVALAPVILWEVRQSNCPARHGYLDSILTPRTAMGESETGWTLQQARLARFGPERMADLAAALIPPHVGWRFLSGRWAFPAACALAAGVIVAAFHGLIRHRRPTDAYLILYVLLLVVWPWDEGARLMSPIAPICIGYAACAGRRMWETRGAAHRVAKSVSIVMAIGVMGVMSWEAQLSTAALNRRADVSTRRLADMQAMGDWLAQHAAPDSRIEAIVPAKDSSKLSLLGGEYLSRCDVVIQHAEQGSNPTNSAETFDWRLIHQSLANGRPAGGTVVDRHVAGQFLAIKPSR